jgi:hypothetical protein
LIACGSLMTETYSGSCCKKCGGSLRYRSNRGCVRCAKDRMRGHIYFPTPATSSDIGQAGEHLVAADLLRRGLIGTKPLNTNGPHDLHFKFSEGWKTIQVKLGRLSPTTGKICIQNRVGVTSDILAMVDLQGMRVRYVANVGDDLPEILR